MMSDEDWMEHALDLAQRAADQDEVPVGAVIVHDGKLVAEGWNCPISSHDPTAHAEIQAIRKASVHFSNYRLLDTTLFVTLEPCAMCVGALIHARIKRLVFGASDPKAGAICSNLHLLETGVFNHKILWESGVIADRCGQILTKFFQKKRENHRLSKPLTE